MHKTEVVKNSKDPTWMPMEISTAKFNLGDMHAGILIEVSSLLVNLKFTSKFQAYK